MLGTSHGFVFLIFHRVFPSPLPLIIFPTIPIRVASPFLLCPSPFPLLSPLFLLLSRCRFHCHLCYIALFITLFFLMRGASMGRDMGRDVRRTAGRVVGREVEECRKGEKNKIHSLVPSNRPVGGNHNPKSTIQQPPNTRIVPYCSGL